jgi:general secretion pathway protein I
MNRCSGFTLLEAVVALAVLALALGAVYQVFASAARQSILLQDYAHALTLAESRLAEAGMIDALAAGVAHGGGAAERGLRWRQTVEPYLSAAAAAEGYVWVPWRITVQVSWERDGRPHVLELTTLRLGRGA